MNIRLGTNIRINNNVLHPALIGQTGTVIWRRGQKFVRVRLDNHEQPLGSQGNGWFLPQSAVTPC